MTSSSTCEVTLLVCPPLGWSEVYRLLNYSEEYIRGKMHDMALNMVTGYLFPEVHLIGLFER